MKAFVFQSKDEPLRITDTEIGKPEAGEVKIQLHYAALNHRDLWIWHEQVLQKPVICGSDGSGVVVDTGAGVDTGWINREVIINPGLYWGEADHIHAREFQILGNPTNGTFAEYINIPVEYVYDKPDHLSVQEAAAIPLAGLTAYRALFSKAKIKQGENLLITGIGGGAALFLLQMAVAIKANVYVSSSSDAKISKALEYGAIDGFNYRDPEWATKAKEKAGGFDVIIDSAAGSNFAHFPDIANPGGRIVMFGRTDGDINGLKPGIIYFKQLHIMGTLMGNPKEFESMISFYEEFSLHPFIDKEFPLSEIAEAAAYMDSGKHFGKILLKIR